MARDWVVELAPSRLLAWHRHEVGISKPLLHLGRELEVVVELSLVVGVSASVGVELLNALFLTPRGGSAGVVDDILML